MTDFDPQEATWRKSTASANQTEACVEAARVPGETLVRDSKFPTGPGLAFSSDAWSGFLETLVSEPS